MENSSLKGDAINNLRETDLKNYSFTNDDLGRLNGWADIATFLVEARTSLHLSDKYNKTKKFTEMEEVILAHAMFKNFVLSYSKCFSSSGKGKISLDANEIFSTRLDLKEVHDEIIKTRNAYVAHNDESDFSVSIVMTLENEKEIILAQTYTMKTPISRFKRFFETLEFCEHQVIIKYNQKVDKIQNRIGKTITFK